MWSGRERPCEKVICRGRLSVCVETNLMNESSQQVVYVVVECRRHLDVFTAHRPTHPVCFCSTVHSISFTHYTLSPFPSKRNRLRWQALQPIMVATASTEHPIGCCLQPIGCSVEAVATMIGCSACQRKRLRLDGNRA